MDRSEQMLMGDLGDSLGLLLDACDYLAGNCRSNEMVGAVLDQTTLKKARVNLAMYEAYCRARADC